MQEKNDMAQSFFHMLPCFRGIQQWFQIVRSGGDGIAQEIAAIPLYRHVDRVPPIWAVVPGQVLTTGSYRGSVILRERPEAPEIERSPGLRLFFDPVYIHPNLAGRSRFHIRRRARWDGQTVWQRGEWPGREIPVNRARLLALDAATLRRPRGSGAEV
jgi:hypothetical protein